MKTVSEHIAHVRMQPHHIRKQIVVASAVGGTILIALVWLIGSLSTSAFSIRGDSSFASSISRQGATAVNGDVSVNQNLAGVAGAAAVLQQDESPPVHIEIIDSTPYTPVSLKKAEQTTIPF